MKKKKKRIKIKDQIYNGAFKNATLTNRSKAAMFGAGFMVLISAVIAKQIK
jgi:hypothetical protein